MGPILFDCWIRIDVRLNWTLATGTDASAQLRNATAGFLSSARNVGCYFPVISPPPPVGRVA